jgi:hypothetical protein
MMIQRTTRPSTPLTSLVLVVALGACAAPGSSPASTDDGVEASQPDASRGVPSAVPSSTAPGSPTAPDGVPAAIWAAILADLSSRLGEAVTDPLVVSAEAVTWNDGALGCPEPGQGYTQALVDGYRVVVEVDAETYDYRTDAGDIVRLCEVAIEGGG